MIPLVLGDPLFPVTTGRPACPDAYAGMADEKVLAIATGAFRRAEALPFRSLTRQAQWQIFDAAMAELGRRAIIHVARKIREQEKAKNPSPR